MKLKKGLTALATSLVVLSGGALVNAGTTYSSYQNVSIPGNNNGVATSSTQTKTTTNASSDLSVSYTSNPNSVDARAVGGAGVSGAWVRNVNTGNYALPNPVKAGAATEIQFSTDLFAATTAMTFKWRSN
jgi:hypothetical protein